MAWMHGHAFGLLVPAWTAGLVRGQAVERFEAWRESSGHQAGRQRCCQGVLSVVVILSHGGRCARTVHPFHLTMGPGRVGCGHPMVKILRMTTASTEMLNGGALALAGGAWEAVIGPHRGDRVGYRRSHVPEERRGAEVVGLGLPRGRGHRTGAVKRDTPGKLAVFRAHVRHLDGDVTDRIAWARFLLGWIALAGWHAPAAGPRHTPVARGARPVGHRRWPGGQASIPRQPRLPATCHQQRRCVRGQDRGVRRCRPHRRIMDIRPRLPFRPSLGMEVIPCGPLGETFLTLLERSTPCRGRAGAPVSSLAHQASCAGRCSDETPSHPGTKQLGPWVSGSLAR